MVVFRLYLNKAVLGFVCLGILLCSSGWPRACYVDQSGFSLKFLAFALPPSLVVGVKAYAFTPGSIKLFCYIYKGIDV